MSAEAAHYRSKTTTKRLLSSIYLGEAILEILNDQSSQQKPKDIVSSSYPSYTAL